jgi:hypothetical protein
MPTRQSLSSEKYKKLTEMTNYSPTFLLCPQEFRMQND